MKKLVLISFLFLIPLGVLAQETDISFRTRIENQIRILYQQVEALRQLLVVLQAQQKVSVPTPTPIPTPTPTPELSPADYFVAEFSNSYLSNPGSLSKPLYCLIIRTKRGDGLVIGNKRVEIITGTTSYFYTSDDFGNIRYCGNLYNITVTDGIKSYSFTPPSSCRSCAGA